jgi:hypothetical protein
MQTPFLECPDLHLGKSQQALWDQSFPRVFSHFVPHSLSNPGRGALARNQEWYINMTTPGVRIDMIHAKKPG